MNITGISGFLATIANNYQQHYLNLSRDSAAGRTPGHYTGRRNAGLQYGDLVESSRPTTAHSAVDTYQKSTPVEKPVETTTTRTDKTQTDEPITKKLPKSADQCQPSGDDNHRCKKDKNSESPVTRYPDGTYSFLRKAELDYSLDLKFNLGAITRTVQQIAEGDVTADVTTVDEFAAAGFGLSADLSLDGSQMVKSADTQRLEPGRTNVRSLDVSKQKGGMSFHSRTVGLDSFYSEATKIRRSLDESVHDSHRRAVNRLAMRYQFDNRFSMTFLNRFNVQTQQVAEQAPEAMGKYADTAGEVAVKGSSQLMAGFFDAVDGYLDSAEAHLVEKVGSLFDQAAAELGFSGVEVAFAKEHLTSTITSFFSRVDQALNAVQTQFSAPEALLAEQYYNPAAASASRQIAVA